ncbi:peptidase S41 [Anaerococcus sp. Marseille-Q5996]|uniref:peptidase S41 n=1 Tax=Anaerococcus sp. Marseille-Q5996 TaxID=2972769 RepID=UPI0021C59781|nr:peptidase S41 [Anaerococcus sp. Marseille-Q5996]
MAKRNSSSSKKSNRSNRRTRSQKTTSYSSSEKRAKQKKIQKQKKFRRRRIGLLIIFLILLAFLINFIVNAANRYKIMGYPDFRDEVLNDMGNEVFVSSSEGRSLSTAEKVTDFDDLFNTIQRNYAVDNLNEEDFEKFISSYNEFRKKVYASKTDQEYFKLIGQYLEVLNDNRTFIIDKETYDSLFEYYRKSNDKARKLVLENPQAVDRYKRLITSSNAKKPSMIANIEREGVLSITLPDFKPNEFDKDLENLVEIFLNNPPISAIILDLSNNSSIDDIYINKLLEILIHENYNKSNLIFYRGNLASKSLDSIKDNENGYYSTANVKNLASKYSEEIENIDLENYSYYDEVSLNINKNQDFSNRKIYVLTNDNTANEAIKLAKILKENGAYIVKNTFDTAITSKDVIYNFRSDLYVMEHSGLVLSLNSAYSKDDESLYLNYDERINSKDPISTILDIIN